MQKSRNKNSIEIQKKIYENTYELDTLMNNVAMTSKAVKFTVTFASK